MSRNDLPQMTKYAIELASQAQSTAETIQSLHLALTRARAKNNASEIERLENTLEHFTEKQMTQDCRPIYCYKDEISNSPSAEPETEPLPLVLVCRLNDVLYTIFVKRKRLILMPLSDLRTTPATVTFLRRRDLEHRDTKKMYRTYVMQVNDMLLTHQFSGVMTRTRKESLSQLHARVHIGANHCIYFEDNWSWTHCRHFRRVLGASPSLDMALHESDVTWFAMPFRTLLFREKLCEAAESFSGAITTENVIAYSNAWVNEVRAGVCSRFPHRLADRSDPVCNNLWNGLETLAEKTRSALNNNSKYQVGLFCAGNVDHASERESESLVLARRIKERLESGNVLDSERKVYLAKCDNHGNFKENIPEAIVGCTLAVFIVSRAWSERPWCFAELLFAMAAGRKCLIIEYTGREKFDDSKLPLDNGVIRCSILQGRAAAPNTDVALVMPFVYEHFDIAKHEELAKATKV